jgi:hypothetical protein
LPTSVRLHEQEGELRPLSNGEVERVEYYLGRSFSGGQAVSKTSAENAFRLDVSAYGSTNCVARIHFKDGSTVDRDRYSISRCNQTRGVFRPLPREGC